MKPSIRLDTYGSWVLWAKIRLFGITECVTWEYPTRQAALEVLEQLYHINAVVR